MENIAILSIHCEWVVSRTFFGLKDGLLFSVAKFHWTFVLIHGKIWIECFASSEVNVRHTEFSFADSKQQKKPERLTHQNTSSVCVCVCACAVCSGVLTLRIYTPCRRQGIPKSHSTSFCNTIRSDSIDVAPNSKALLFQPLIHTSNTFKGIAAPLIGSASRSMQWTQNWNKSEFKTENKKKWRKIPITKSSLPWIVHNEMRKWTNDIPYIPMKYGGTVICCYFNTSFSSYYVWLVFRFALVLTVDCWQYRKFKQSDSHSRATFMCVQYSDE